MARFLYSQRPSKHIQRKMVVDACRRLRAFAPLNHYEFIGFGAYEFVDFELVRRELGVCDMHSIELNWKDQDRYLFNRPFEGIEIHFDRASNVLPDLLDKPRLRIVWLDYTTNLNAEVLQDLGVCFRKLTPGSVVLVSVAARPSSPASTRRSSLVDAVGLERVSPEHTNEWLGKNFATAQRSILMEHVTTETERRDDGARFQQLFNVGYRDDQPMQTWGGLIVSPSMAHALGAAHFEELEQVSADERFVNTTVEPLTTREVLHLNRQLPLASDAKLIADGIPDKALDAYARLYRWYPAVPAAM